MIESLLERSAFRRGRILQQRPHRVVAPHPVVVHVHPVDDLGFGEVERVAHFRVAHEARGVVERAGEGKRVLPVMRERKLLTINESETIATAKSEAEKLATNLR